MKAKITVMLTRRKLSPARLLQRCKPESCTGAIATFTGVVRGKENGRPIQALQYSGYESMAKKQLNEIVASAARRWPLHVVFLAHRVGRVKTGEAAVFLAVEAEHRKEAFAACKWIIDRLKKVVPLWKEVEQ